MLVLPERVPLKAFKGFESICLQNQFHIWGICICHYVDIWRGKNTQYNFIYEN